MEETEYIYHFILPEEWARYENQSFYNPPSIEEEGFIHCCFDKQFKHVLDNYYKGAKEIYILKIHVPSLDVAILVEESSSGKAFPHIYGMVKGDAIEEIMVFKI